MASCGKGITQPREAIATAVQFAANVERNGRNEPAKDRLIQALGLLLKLNRARREGVKTGGRLAEIWFPARGAR